MNKKITNQKQDTANKVSSVETPQTQYLQRERERVSYLECYRALNL